MNESRSLDIGKIYDTSDDIDGLVQDLSNSIDNAQLLQFCTETSI